MFTSSEFSGVLYIISRFSPNIQRPNGSWWKRPRVCMCRNDERNFFCRRQNSSWKGFHLVIWIPRPWQGGKSDTWRLHFRDVKCFCAFFLAKNFQVTIKLLFHFRWLLRHRRKTPQRWSINQKENIVMPHLFFLAVCNDFRVFPSLKW